MLQLLSQLRLYLALFDTAGGGGGGGGTVVNAMPMLSED
jgi:hypothetical protein